MTARGRRVALLARPGVACDRLRGALADAGAEVVLEADPMTLDPAALGAAQAQVVMVALDAQVEDVLERFDAALQDPAIEVIFEEAELAARREGWEAARWVRHIAAKLHHHADVLPPGTEAASLPAAPHAGTPTQADGPGEPVDPASPAPVSAPSDLQSINTGHAFDPLLAEIDGDIVSTPFTWAGEPGAPAVSTVEDGQLAATFNPGLDFPYDDGSSTAPADSPDAATASADPAAFRLDLDEEFSLDDLRVEPRSTVHELDLVLDGDFSTAVNLAPANPAPNLADAGEAPAAPVGASPVLGLVAADEEPPPRLDIDSAAVDKRFKRDLASLESRIAGMELVDDRIVKGPAKSNGAVLVLSGIGGPDAVRQLLGALPADFSRPVLVQQRLDGGRYDKLVAQMQRATSLRVKLAEPGVPAIAGVIYILPQSTGIKVDDSGIQFTDAGDDVLAALPSADSAVLLLSGSDPAQVDAVMNHSWAGALVIGQAPDGCYDATAPSALVARGGESGQPADLARRLAERWGS